MTKPVKFEKITNGSKYKGIIKGVHYWGSSKYLGFYYIELFDKNRGKTLYIPIKHLELYDIYTTYDEKFEKGKRIYMEVHRNDDERGRPFHYKVIVDGELLKVK